MNMWKGLRPTDSEVKITLNFPHGKFLRRRDASLFVVKIFIQDVRRRMVEIQWKDRLVLEQEWMELYVGILQEIEILWMNHAEGIK